MNEKMKLMDWSRKASISEFRSFVESDPVGAPALLHYLQWGGTVLVDAELGHVWKDGRGSGYGCYGTIR